MTRSCVPLSLLPGRASLSVSPDRWLTSRRLIEKQPGNRTCDRTLRVSQVFQPWESRAFIAAHSLPARSFGPEGFFPSQERRKGTNDRIKTRDFVFFMGPIFQAA